MIMSINISESSKVFSQNSKGSQLKYNTGTKWYKVNTVGCESDAEAIASTILKCSTVKDFVEYAPVRINGRLGCVSESFLDSDEVFVSFEDLYYNSCHRSLANDIRAFSSVEARYWFILEKIQEYTKLDIQEYLDNNLVLDFLLLNPDRHFNNLGVILQSGYYKIAPIFDNGQGLGANWTITNPSLSYDECCSVLTAGTISGSFDAQFLCTKNRFKIDYIKVAECLKELSVRSRCLLFADRQLRKHRHLFEM